MISQIAKNIEDGLNALQTKYQFVIQYTVGDFQVPQPSTPRVKSKPIINGILTQVPGDIDAVANLKSYRLSAILTLIPNVAQAEECRACLENLAVNLTGSAVALIGSDNTHYAGIAYIGTPNVGGIVQGGEDGREVPITTTVSYQLIAEGVVSSDVHFSLDGEELLAIQSSVGRANLLQTDAIANYAEMLSTDNSSACNFTFLLPYRKTMVIAKIVDEILRHNFGAVHYLEYVDEYLSETLSERYSYAVILKDGSLNAEAGKVVSISVTFSIANNYVYVAPPEITFEKGSGNVTVNISSPLPTQYCTGRAVDEQKVEKYTEHFRITRTSVYGDTYVFAKVDLIGSAWEKAYVPICPPPAVRFVEGSDDYLQKYKALMSLNTSNPEIIANGQIQYTLTPSDDDWKNYDKNDPVHFEPKTTIYTRVVCDGFVSSLVLRNVAPSGD